MMADGILWRRTDADAHTTAGACTRFDHGTGSAIFFDHAHGAFYRAVVYAEGAGVSLPRQAGLTIDRRMRHRDGKLMTKHSRFAGVDAGQLAAHHAWRSQSINHRSALSSFASGFWSGANGPRRADVDAVAASRAGRKELPLGYGAGRPLEQPK